MRRRDFITMLVVAVAFVPAAAQAQTYPTRPVVMVVPFAAGGAFDVMGRILAVRMSELLGQQVVVENTTGAGGIVGAMRVMNAAPRRLHLPVRQRRHPRLQSDDVQEHPLQRRDRFRARHSVRRPADDALGAQGFPRQQHAGVFRLLESQCREAAIRLSRHRLDHASRVLAGELHHWRQRHARSISRLGAGRTI